MEYKRKKDNFNKRCNILIKIVSFELDKDDTNKKKEFTSYPVVEDAQLNETNVTREEVVCIMKFYLKMKKLVKILKKPKSNAEK